MGAPTLTYAQLFSFQVAHRKGGRKNLEWGKTILELDFSMGSILLLDRERVVVEQPFNNIKCTSTKDPDDPFMSISFGLKPAQLGRYDEWELNVQNCAEKNCLLHLLECIRRDMTAEEAVRHGRGIVGLVVHAALKTYSAESYTSCLNLPSCCQDQRILKYGVILCKAKARRKRTERFLVIVPGKLFMFAGTNILGRHVRFVTSLFQANVKMSYTHLEFQVIPQCSEEEEMDSWITALEESIQRADEIAKVKQEIESNKSVSDKEDGRYSRGGRISLSGQCSNNAYDDEQHGRCTKEEESQQWVDGASDEGHGRVSLSRQRLNSAIGDMTDMIERLNAGRRYSPRMTRQEEPGRGPWRSSVSQYHPSFFATDGEQLGSYVEDPYKNDDCCHSQEHSIPQESLYAHPRARANYEQRNEAFGHRSYNRTEVRRAPPAWQEKDPVETFRESWQQQRSASNRLQLPQRKALDPFIIRKIF